MKSIYRVSILIFLFSFQGYTIFSQTSKPDKAHFDVELDPIAYALKGFSVHLGYQKNVIRYDAGVFGLDEPSSFSVNKDFKVRLKGFGIKAIYMGNKPGGWFAGIGTDYGFVNATHKLTGDQKKGNTIGIGINGGYRVLVGKTAKTGSGLYFSPWLGVDKVFFVKKPVFTSTTYKEQNIRFFPTVHVGWRF